LSSEKISLENGKLLLQKKSLQFGFDMHKNLNTESVKKSFQDLDLDEFEKKIVSEIIPPSELDVKFENIGALEDVKKILHENVMLPLLRPELFSRGNLTKPCKGILLFGLPGTGKTMLAKAVAAQSGANFVNISMSTIASKWFGEGEKFVRAIFSLASKISPTVIFIDEVDSILGKRDKSGEHEAMRKIKNEFMTNWDGLKTRPNERVLVLGATNRPFDLDEAVLRRFPRRILVELPNKTQRIQILKKILNAEVLQENFDFESISNETEGYSGSDLKNLCIAAAHQPIRELLEQEKKNPDLPKTNNLRPVSTGDFQVALKEIGPSTSEETSSISQLKSFNEMYGQNAKKKEVMPYFL